MKYILENILETLDRPVTTYEIGKIITFSLFYTPKAENPVFEILLNL